MRCTFIDEHRHVWPVRIQCRVLDVSTSAFYAWKQAAESDRQRENAELSQQIQAIFDEHRGSYGEPRITEELRARSYTVNHKRVARLLRDLGLQGRHKRKFKPCTTQCDPDGPVFPDLIKRDFTAENPNERWVGDITYLRTTANFVYLATVIDLYSRKVVGWAMADSLESPLVVDALSMAIKQRRPPAGVIFHSDRGSQYTSELFRTFCQDHHVQQSMGRTGSCYDNAAAESFFHSLKVEWLYPGPLTSPEIVRNTVFHYIEAYYNPKRRHSHNGQLSPDAFEKQASRHHAPPRSGAQRAPDKKYGDTSNASTPTHNCQSAIRPPARRSVPAPSGCLPPAGSTALYPHNSKKEKQP